MSEIFEKCMFPEKEKLSFPIEILLVACQRLAVALNSDKGFAEGFVLPFRFERITFKELILHVILLYRSSHQSCYEGKSVLRNFAKFTEKHLCQSLYFNKVAGQACNFIKIEALAQVFPVNFAKFLRTPFLQNTSGRLLLTLGFFLLL